MKRHRISALLLELGTPAHLSGFGFLLDAVELVGERPELLRRMTGELYPAVAEGRASTPRKVERAIRFAIEAAWLRGVPEIQEKYFGSSVSVETGKPTNAQYIATLAHHLRMEVPQ